MRRRSLAAGLLLTFAAATMSCEIDTTLSVEGGNPPTFVMSGNGILTSIRVRGHERQREAEGESQYLYWVIESKEGGARSVWSLSSVTYGKVPEGYQQIYPEAGQAPPLVEGQHYYVHVVTADANGADGYFMIINNKALFAKYDSELPDERKMSSR